MGVEMKQILALFTRKQTTIGSAAFVLMIMVFASRVLGLVRDRLLSARFGPDELGVYFAAFRLPNLLFELLVMGALTAAFIPVFTRFITQKNQAAAWKMTAVLLNSSLIILGIILVPLLIWTKNVSIILAPGLTERELNQMTQFTQFMLVFQVVPLLVGNLFTGVLQSYALFFIPAAAPVVYNAGIIAGIIILSPSLGMWGPVIGVGLGALFFLLIQVPLMWQIGYRHEWIIDMHKPGVKEVAKLMAPRTLSLAISQIDTTVDLMLASLLGSRMITIFNFAQHLQQLPIGLFGQTIAQAALPALSETTVREDLDRFKSTIVSAMHQMLFFILPASVLFIVLRIPIVRLVFGASRFDWQATVLTGMTLSMFSISLFAQAISQLLTRGFFALYDSRTPLAVGVVNICINIACSLIFVSGYGLPVWSLGLSTTIASIVNVVLLYIILHRRIGGLPMWATIMPIVKMFVASAVAGMAIYIPLKLFDQLVFDTTRVFGLILLTGVVGFIGVSCYLFLSWVMGVGEVHAFIRLLRKFRRPDAILLNPASEVVNGGAQDQPG